MATSKAVAILSAARTPVGKLGGALSGEPAPSLGAVAVRGAVESAGLEPGQVDYAIMGNVLSAGLGQSPARQAAIGAGLPDTCSALLVNKVCASGLTAVVLAAQAIKAGDAGIVVSGGMESMSRAPHLLKGSRFGRRMGDWDLEDTMVHDGLWCCFNDRPMGDLAEATAAKFEISREEQDRFAVSSHQKAVHAAEVGGFNAEVVSVTVEDRKGTREVDADEGPRADTSMEALAKLPAAFPPNATITAGNASQISDGAAALTVADEPHARELGLEPMAIIEDYAAVGIDPARLFEAPVLAIEQLLRKGGMALSDIDLLEVNEAFPSQVLANGKVLDWDWDKLNVKGGAIALGHPLAASGARILVTLIHSLRDRGLGTGIAALCHGGGGAVAMRISMC